jgi:hypothetical protein
MNLSVDKISHSYILIFIAQLIKHNIIINLAAHSVNNMKSSTMRLSNQLHLLHLYSDSDMQWHIFVNLHFVNVMFLNLYFDSQYHVVAIILLH